MSLSIMRHASLFFRGYSGDLAAKLLFLLFALEQMLNV